MPKASQIEKEERLSRAVRCMKPCHSSIKGLLADPVGYLTTSFELSALHARLTDALQLAADRRKASPAQ